MTRTIQELVEPGEVADAWPVMRQLRPHLDETQFLSQVTAQRAEGYRLVGIWSRDRICAVAGFRVVTMLARGRHLYVDDLVTDEHARVLRADGSVIPGLYAAGNVSSAVMGNTYPGPGGTIGPAMTFGYLAALHIAGQS